MLTEVALILASVIPVMLIGKGIAVQFNENSFFIVSSQSLIGLVFGYAIATIFTLYVPLVVAGTTLAPILVTLLVIADRKWQKRKTLNGKYGIESQWAAELVEDDDREFEIAMQHLPEMHLREVGVIAESKDELRELTIDRFDEFADEDIPEDFAQ